jgi:hypothetical protein
MTIDELNRKLKPFGEVAEMNDYGTTLITKIRGHETVVQAFILDDGTFKTINTYFTKEEIMAIAEYINTPIYKRGIPKVYNIIFRKHEEACYYNVLSRDSYGKIKETTATSYELSTDSSYFFTKKDIEKICKLHPQKADSIIKSAKEVKF